MAESDKLRGHTIGFNDRDWARVERLRSESEAAAQAAVAGGIEVEVDASAVVRKLVLERLDQIDAERTRKAAALPRAS